MKKKNDKLLGALNGRCFSILFFDTKSSEFNKVIRGKADGVPSNVVTYPPT